MKAVESQDILTLSHITKLYPGVTALDDVSVTFRQGEIHALCGENGAGKSTLMKVLAGAITPEGGTIELDGESYPGMTPKLSREKGVEVIYQEYNLIDTLSAAENICLGDKQGWMVDFKAMERTAREIFDRFRIDIDPKAEVGSLTNARKQIVEIAKAVSKNVRILVMDEPTAPLTVTEVEILMNIIADLKKKGVTIIYISHRLEEIFEIADRVTVMRDGRYVATRDIADITRQDLINMMVGRELNASFPERSGRIGEPVLELRDVTGNGDENISFTLHRGEILGLGGLVGAGRTELARMIVGADKMESGQLLVRGEPVTIRSEKDAIRLGIGLIPEDRKVQGCLLDMDIKWNISIMNIRGISRGLVVDRKREDELGQSFRDALKIKTPSLSQEVRNLSGGNQQKVVIAKTLAANSDIIIFDEPTRGIDVNAKHEIYLLMNRLTEEGKSIIMISSEMEELLGMSDRIVVLWEGLQTGIVERKDFTQARILDLASGGSGQ